MPEPLLTRYLQPLLAGRRAECFSLITDAIKRGHSAEEVIHDVLWPAMTQTERLYRDDRIDRAIENMACRINRTVADQLQAHLPQWVPNGKRIIITSADEPREEIGAQMLADLFQSNGWDVYFIGAGVPHDELLHLVGRLSATVLLVYGTQPPEVPAVRRLVELIREVGVCPTMNIVVSGGVFNRVDGLWQEVGADVFAELPGDVVKTVEELGPRKPGPRRLGIVKKRRRRRKTPPLWQSPAEAVGAGRPPEGAHGGLLRGTLVGG
jgi:methanogenic corrinoid protein MtbC1